VIRVTSPHSLAIVAAKVMTGRVGRCRIVAAVGLLPRRPLVSRADRTTDRLTDQSTGHSNGGRTAAIARQMILQSAQRDDACMDSPLIAALVEWRKQ